MDTEQIAEAESRIASVMESRMESRIASETESRIEEIDEMLSCFSLFYLRPQPESWKRLEQHNTWQRFIGSIQRTLERREAFERGVFEQFLIRRLSGHQSGGWSLRQLPAETSLSLWLRKTAGFSLEVDELLRAPRFETQLDFARRHLVGGLPVSVLPIESLHSRWTRQESASLPFARQSGLYNGDAAAHMASLLRQFELTVTTDASLPPDHLVVELNVLGLLICYGSVADVHQFIDDHLSWLPDYLDALPGKIPSARVFIAITILLNACLETLYWESLTGPEEMCGTSQN
ncbi:MAG: molecular chaperone TorD family protein [Coriobacteriales bacterium]|jgi:hypothetical protein|nr:molecular chaperone TorD family protein [Coriobacteriales bacterium]